MLNWGVYPRVCGGTFSGVLSIIEGGGLSPRVRGNRIATHAGLPSARSIPACAGEPQRLQAALTAPPVYPRVCGGTDFFRPVECGCYGLSPRVRGNQFCPIVYPSTDRSIPACAGEPGHDVLRWQRGEVYPRVCGGTADRCPAALESLGLSPRVRGNHLHKPLVSVRLRSIPACAGEPRGSEVWLIKPRVYPRVCGGTSSIWAMASIPTGLSPRVRGNQNVCTARRRRPRSIPACAGEPISRRLYQISSTVYPRVCGGTLGARRRCQFDPGLSPRVRGNHSSRVTIPVSHRSIPACAGEPTVGSASRIASRVYPRVCGGTMRCAV